MVETMKSVVFWDMTSCGSCKNRRPGGTYHLMEAKRSSENPVLTRPTRRHIPEDDTLQISINFTVAMAGIHRRGLVLQSIRNGGTR
jgi:hypothetical protein